MRHKGVTIIGELIAFIFMIGVGYFVSGLALFGIPGFTAIGGFQFNIVDTARIMALHQENLLSAGMELTDTTGVPYKTIIAAAVAQHTPEPYIGGTKMTGTLDRLFTVLTDATASANKYILFTIADSRGNTIYSNAARSFSRDPSHVFKKAALYIPSPDGIGVIEFYEVVD